MQMTSTISLSILDLKKIGKELKEGRCEYFVNFITKVVEEKHMIYIESIDAFGPTGIRLKCLRHFEELRYHIAYNELMLYILRSKDSRKVLCLIEKYNTQPKTVEDIDRVTGAIILREERPESSSNFDLAIDLSESLEVNNKACSLALPYILGNEVCKDIVECIVAKYIM